MLEDLAPRDTVAADQRVPFIDLNELIAAQHDRFGPEKVEPLFADPQTHTSRAGTELNAATVVAGLRQLTGNPLKRISRRTLRVEPPLICLRPDPRLAVAMGGALRGVDERSTLTECPAGSPPHGPLERSQNKGNMRDTHR